MASGHKRLNLPIRRSQHRFALTPLADAMFQLLIFFMLTSNLSPYSLLTLKSAARAEAPAAQGVAGNPQASPAATTAGEVALWTVQADKITVGGQAFGFDRLGDLAAALGSDITPASVILIVKAGARVQDVTSVLEALHNANIASLQVMSGAG